MKQGIVGSVVMLVVLGAPLDGKSTDKVDDAKAKEAPKEHILIDKDCPEELEFKKKLAAGIRESNLAIFPLAAVAVVEEAAVIADLYWDKTWNTFVDGARERASKAGVLKASASRKEGFDTRSDLGQLCQAVASRNIELCQTPTPEQRTRCLLQVGLYSDCAVAGPYQAVCQVITNPGKGTCESLGGAEETCNNLSKLRSSLDGWCGTEGARKATPECLGAMAVNARVQGAKSCVVETGLEKLSRLCNAMVSGNVEGCGQALSGLEAGEPAPKAGTALPALKTHVEGALVSASHGERNLLLWAAASRKAVCHVKATIKDAQGAQIATVEDVVRVLDNRTTDTQISVPLRQDVDIFTSSVAIESQCTARYWW